MRVTTTLLLLSFLSFSSQAQYNKGSKLVGGLLSVSSSEDYYTVSDEKTTNIRFSPSAGVFYKKNRLAGVNLSGEVTDFPEARNAFGYGGGVFLRQYYPIKKSAFSFFLHESANVSFAKSNQNINGAIDNYRVKSMAISASFAPAFAYAPTRRLQVEARFPEFLTMRYFRQQPVSGAVVSNYDYSHFTLVTGLQDISSFAIGLSLLF